MGKHSEYWQCWLPALGLSRVLCNRRLLPGLSAYWPIWLKALAAKPAIWLHCTLSLVAQCIVISPVCLCVFVCLWVCYHNNSKLRTSIFTKLGLYVKVVTISTWLNFSRSAPPKMGSVAGQNFLAPARSVSVTSERLFKSVVCLLRCSNAASAKRSHLSVEIVQRLEPNRLHLQANQCVLRLVIEHRRVTSACWGRRLPSHRFHSRPVLPTRTYST